MPTEIKPIKRSKELAPLSRDHHEGLLLVWKIKTGLKNGTPINVIAQYVHWFWTHHLQIHFKEEEQILAPCLPKENELMQQMIEEHEEIEALIHINENIADETVLTQIAQKLNDHIRFEERQLFPWAEKIISADELTKIGYHLAKENNKCPKWEDEFWIAKKNDTKFL